MKSVEEFDRDIRHYSALVLKRDKRILTLTTILFLVFFAVPLTFGKSTVILSLTGLCILGTYVVLTSRIFHKQNGIYCQYCSCSLAPNNEVHDTIDSCLNGHASEVLCPKCKKAVAGRT